MTRSRAWRAVAAAVVALAVAVAGLAILIRGGDVDVAVPEDSGTTSAAPTTAGALRAPLTGLVVTEELNHPAVAIKVSDVRQAHPQAGVDQADIVFVEPIGPSYTRLAAVFHSQLPDTVGPVRSVRPMDAALLGPLAPVFGNTMGAPWVMEYVDEVANLDDLGTLRVPDSDAYFVYPQRPAPDHVFARPQVLLDLSSFSEPPAPYFQHAADPSASSAVLSGDVGQVVEVPYGLGWRVRWTYDEAGGRYLREVPWGPHNTIDDVQVGAVNVLVLEVPSAIGKIGDAGGAPVPILELVDSSGPLLALSGGHSVTGTWSKAGVNDPFVLRTDSGQELELAPGNTWVELPAPDAGVMLNSP